MWRGENPIEDFDPIMSQFPWSLLSQQSILAGMKESSAFAEVKSLGPAEKRKGLEPGMGGQKSRYRPDGGE